MSDEPFLERRRHKRFDCKGTYFWRTVLNAPVRLLDISQGGALLATSAVVPLCDAGRLRMRFGGMPFEADVRLVRFTRPEAAATAAPYEVAAVFASMDERSRGVMTQFLKHPGGVRA